MLCCFLFCVAVLHGACFAQNDSVKAKLPKPKEDYGHQLRAGFDLAQPVFNLAKSTRTAYEAELDYYIRKEIYVVAEGGFGTSNYDYPDLSYKTSNSFFRLGIDRTIIARLGQHDWDAVFFGVRYGVGLVNRGDASYLITDSVWGNTSGMIPGKTFSVQWFEVVSGVRVELLKNVFAGWNLRARFLLNEGSFRELSPAFIAGYGRGDKTTVFDFNFYLCYALRWGGAPKKE